MRCVTRWLTSHSFSHKRGFQYFRVHFRPETAATSWLYCCRFSQSFQEFQKCSSKPRVTDIYEWPFLPFVNHVRPSLSESCCSSACPPAQYHPLTEWNWWAEIQRYNCGLLEVNLLEVLQVGEARRAAQRLLSTDHETLGGTFLALSLILLRWDVQEALRNDSSSCLNF